VFLIAVFYGWRGYAARQTITLIVLPLKGGHAVFIHDGKSAGNLLVDCGDTNSVNFITLPFLHGQGINHLPRLALTQGDLRDMGGALALCDAFSIGEVFTSAVRFRSSAYRQARAVLAKQPGRQQVVNCGEAIGIWQVIYPTATNNFPQADDNSLVLQGKIQNVKILLVSDLGRRGQEMLVNQTNDLHADIVVTGLPEKSQPLSDALLAKIQPHIIIVADSDFPATKRAPAALRERLAQRNVTILYTRQTGAVTLTTKPGEWELRTMDGQKFQSSQAGLSN
jgi:beta-lactamase superfamily II metal-dependent hydrolase